MKGEVPNLGIRKPEPVTYVLYRLERAEEAENDDAPQRFVSGTAEKARCRSRSPSFRPASPMTGFPICCATGFSAPGRGPT